MQLDFQILNFDKSKILLEEDGVASAFKLGAGEFSPVPNFDSRETQYGKVTLVLSYHLAANPNFGFTSRDI
jgi:hypothetical protein